jgi:hypothetical protein
MKGRWKDFSLLEKFTIIVTLPFTLPVVIAGGFVYVVVTGIGCMADLLFGD